MLLRSLALTACAALLLAPAAHANAVQDKLTRGISAKQSDSDKLATLMMNMSKAGFSYGGAGKEAQLLAGTSTGGDCGAFARLFVKVATEILHIKGVKTDFAAKESNVVFVKGGGSTLDAKRNGNTDDGKHWTFGNHVWAYQEGGKVYDVLFNRVYATKDDLLKSFVFAKKSGNPKQFTVDGVTYYSW
jgi:hypothetical protein